MAINSAEVFFACQLNDFTALGILHLQVIFHLDFPAGGRNEVVVGSNETQLSIRTFRFGEQERSLFKFILEKVLAQCSSDLGWNDDIVAHADSSPRKQRLIE